MTNDEKAMLQTLEPGGECRLILFHPGRKTERPLSFELDPGDAKDPDIIDQILNQIRGYIPQKAYLNGKLVWEKPVAPGRAQTVINFDYDRVNTSY